MLNYNWNLFAQAGLFGWKLIGLRGKAFGKSLFLILVLGVGRSFLGLGRWQRISFGSNSGMEVKSFCGLIIDILLDA
jgi:putative lipase involved disintegration of autophagic bodies